MTRLTLPAVLVVTLAVVAATRADTISVLRVGASDAAVSRLALAPGAIMEDRLRVPWPKLEEYLDRYAEWFLPVDQDSDSGRDLVTVLLRDFGDHYNLVFVYRYASQYKEGYYCHYSKAFFEEHKEKKADDGAAVFPEALRDSIRKYFSDGLCEKQGPPPELMDVIRTQDQALRAMVDLDEGTWNLEVDPCKVRLIRQKKTSPKDLATCAQ